METAQPGQEPPEVLTILRCLTGRRPASMKAQGLCFQGIGAVLALEASGAPPLREVSHPTPYTHK